MSASPTAVENFFATRKKITTSRAERMFGRALTSMMLPPTAKISKLQRTSKPKLLASKPAAKMTVTKRVGTDRPGYLKKKMIRE